jgi:phosphocarrier protein
VTSCAVDVTNPLGLHARAAAKFVHVAGRFASAVRVSRLGREIDGKSIMGLLLLSASQGTAITITVDGPDEREALGALCALVQRGFDEAPADGVRGTP